MIQAVDSLGSVLVPALDADRRPGVELSAGLLAEYLDFRDRSHGMLAPSEVAAAIAGGRFVWIDLDTRQADAAAAVAALPPGALDGLNHEAIAAGAGRERGTRLFRQEKLLQIRLVGLVACESLSGCEAGPGRLVGQALDVIIGEGFLLTLHDGPCEVLAAVRGDYLHDFHRHAATPSYLVYEIWNEQVEQFLAMQNRLEEEVDITRLKLRGTADEATLQELADVTGRLLALRKRVLPARRVLEELVSRKTTLVSEATLAFLGKMIETLERLLSDIGSNLGILESAMNFSLTVATHRTNTIMNRLAVVSTIFLPLTFLCGVYGMNFEVIPETTWTHGYYYFWGVSAAITLVMVVALRRAKLL